MRAIFISYRREDSEGQARRLFDTLVAHFGEDRVFMEIAGIERERDFHKAIDQRASNCAALVALIGKQWLDLKDTNNRRRLDDPLDLVRLETALALKRNVPVVPVLVQGACMPRAEQLPAAVADLAYRTRVELTDARWDSDVRLLIEALSAHMTPSERAAKTASTEHVVHALAVAYPSSRMPMIAIAVASLIAIGLIVFSGTDQAKHKQRGLYENAADAVVEPYER
jgi:hypothetical protein